MTKWGLICTNLILLSVLIAVAANLDNLGVGIAYGIQNIRVSLWANIIIAAISFAAAWLSGMAGEVIRFYLSPQTANIIGAIMLSAVGIWVTAQPIITAIRENYPLVDLKISNTRIYVGPTEILAYPERVDIDNSRDVSCWEAVLLGIALSINAMAGGFDAGVVGIPYQCVSLFVGIFSFITVFLGCYFGKKYAAEPLGKYATVISGTLLILIGLHQIIH